MSDVKHTAEPWRYTRFVIYGGNSGEICSGAVEENARRIVACVNALQGVPTEFLENAVLMGITDVSQGNLFSRRVELQSQRDQLLEALECLFASYKQLADSGDAGNWSLEDAEEGKKALAAISAVKGKK